MRLTFRPYSGLSSARKQFQPVPFYSFLRLRSTMAASVADAHDGNDVAQAGENGAPKKLHGRAFYESIGSPKLVLAPMVDQSEFAWRMLSRSFLPADDKAVLLAYSPMFHSRLWVEDPKYAPKMWQPIKPKAVEDEKEELWLDGNPKFDRPLFVQFCANDPDILIAAAKTVAPYCDAVDLNLGCPQGIAKKGHYGAFLQEDQDLIFRLINRLHKELPIPVTAKFRILETKEKTLDYAKMLISAGASILTVHGRQRHMKGHYTGLADWTIIRYLRDNLPPETVMFANGNILQHGDIQRSLDATGVDGIMSAEGNLHDPAIFAAPPPVGSEGREYWRGRDGNGGWRADAVVRRYLDIIYKHVLGQEPPARKPLFIPGDPPDETEDPDESNDHKEDHEEGPQKKKNRRQKRLDTKNNDSSVAVPKGPNFHPMQAHMFSILRMVIGVHTQIRDALAKSRAGNMEAFENVLKMLERITKDALIEYENNANAEPIANEKESIGIYDDPLNSEGARLRCKRPWWVCQPYLRPFPNEMIEKGLLIVKGQEKNKAKETPVQISPGEETANKLVESQTDAALSG